MILLEGPDGAGKTTLRDRLKKDLHLPLGPRACTSTGGPVDDLLAWAYRDIQSWGRDSQFIKLYDRHPMVSEYVYGPLIRGKKAPGFDTGTAHGLHQFLVRNTFTIFCLPPLSQVRFNVYAEDGRHQMSGVPAKIEKIYFSYQDMAKVWPSPHFVWDYTKPDREMQYHSLVTLLQDYMNTRERMSN